MNRKTGILLSQEVFLWLEGKDVQISNEEELKENLAEKYSDILVPQNMLHDDIKEYLDDDIKEFLETLIDIAEDFLEEIGITVNDIPNDEREEEECAAIIYGTDYDILEHSFSEILGFTPPYFDDVSITIYPDPMDEEEISLTGNLLASFVCIGLEDGLVTIFTNPNDGKIACKIGDYWFYFINPEYENWTVQEIYDKFSSKELSLMIAKALTDMKNDGFSDEFSYYEDVLMAPCMDAILDDYEEEYISKENPLQ